MVMVCQAEPQNKYDKNAVLVKCPPLMDIPQDQWDVETRGADSRSPRQTVRDVAGRQVGRVPKEICKVISKGLLEGWIKRAVTIHTGGFVHNKGPQLKCIYMLYIQPHSPISMCDLRAKLQPYCMFM